MIQQKLNRTQEEIEKLTKCLEPINNSENYYLI